MDVEFQQHIRTLATLDETTSPVVSCYLDIQSGPGLYKTAFAERVHVLRKSLFDGALTSVEEAAGVIEDFLNTQLEPGIKGVALFARGGPNRFFLPLQFRVALPTWIAIGPTPNLYHLVELKDNYDRYVVLIANDAGARIIGINLGAATEQIWSTRPELRRRLGREWSKDHFQDHRRARNHQFVHEQIRTLERLLNSGGYSHLILAGNPRMAAEIRRELPKSIASKLIDVVPASPSDRLSDVVACTLRTFLEHEELESEAIAERLVHQIHAHGLAVAGSGPCLTAVAQGQADALVIVKSYEPGHGRQCPDCGWKELEESTVAVCPTCGRGPLRSFDIKSELVRLAELSDCHIEIVEHSDALSSLGGVGCLLRYLAPRNVRGSGGVRRPRCDGPELRVYEFSGSEPSSAGDDGGRDRFRPDCAIRRICGHQRTRLGRRDRRCAVPSRG